MNKVKVFTFLIVILPALCFAQNWFIGGTVAYNRSNLKMPDNIFEQFNKGVNEYNIGVSVTKRRQKNFSVHFSLNFNNLWLISETEDIDSRFGFDPELDLKYSLNYLNTNVKILYYKNNPVDGISIGVGTFMYMFQTKNYDIAYNFSDLNKFYNTLSVGYFCYPIKNLLAELAFESNITAFGDTTFSGAESKWAYKYWKYGLRVSVTYNFFSLPKKSKSKNR